MFRNFFSFFKSKKIFIPISMCTLTIFKTNSRFIFMHNEEEGGKLETTLKNINKKLYILEQKVDNINQNDISISTSLNDFPIFLKNSNYSLLKNVLDQDVWRRNYNLRTIEGHNINDIIQAGLDNLDHPIGVVATSADAYSTFEEILISCANKFHKRNLNLSNHQKENYVLVKNFITEMEEFINDKCIEYEIISNRNINNYCFSSKISRSERKEVLNFLINSIKKIENEVFSTNGLFVELDKHESPRKMQFNEFLKSAGIYRDWPDGRAIYFNANNFFNVIINEEDHLKVILRQKNDKSYKKS